MADGRSFSDGLAYSGNAYAYAYAYSTNAYAYSAPGDNSGIGGFAGDPMLAAAITATRDALLSEVTIEPLGQDGDRRAGIAFSGAPNATSLPAVSHAPDIHAYGTQVRASLALFELQSSVAFRMDGEKAVLDGTHTVGQDNSARATLVTMERPSRTYFESQLQLVDSWSARRDVRAAEIVTQVAPPVAYFASLLNLQVGRHRRTLELVNAALQFTYAVCMQFKHALACPRPSEYSLVMQPMIEVPMHPTLPAGHAAEAHVTAAVLGALAGAEAGKSKTDELLRRLAHRIAENRVISGVHFPCDMTSGRLLGDAVASYVLARCGVGVEWWGGAFKADGANGQVDTFDAAPRFSGPGCKAFTEARKGSPSPLLAEMWNAAAAEWQRKDA